jgi:hypothetical protein
MAQLDVAVIPNHLTAVVQTVHVKASNGDPLYYGKCTCKWETGRSYNFEDAVEYDLEIHRQLDVGELIVLLDYHLETWICPDCACINGRHEAFCYLCGAGPEEYE